MSLTSHAAAGDLVAAITQSRLAAAARDLSPVTSLYQPSLYPTSESGDYFLVAVA